MVEIKTLPALPGCYLFRDVSNRIIYVGKAKDLRRRVRSYFQKPIHDPKTNALLKSIDSVDFIVTNTEVEAFILENTLIKKHQPKYNINLKDAKTYAFIERTDEPFPRLLVARKKTGAGHFYGPFVSAQERDYVLYFLNRTFHLRTCKKIPKKACLRYHLQLCDAPCIGHIYEQEYREKLSKVHLILTGKSTQLLQQLTQQMKQYSASMEFEKALQLRNQRDAIKHLQERQMMQRQHTTNEDVINHMVRDSTVYLMVFNIYKGTLSQKNEFVFSYHEDFLEEFLVQYYSEHPVPSEIIVPRKIDTSLSLFLQQQRHAHVRVQVPQKGTKKQLLDLVLKNIEITFFADVTKVEELQKRLQLQELPQVIECIDISHLSGTSMVGSLVQFRNGKPDKSNYRRFRIRTVEGIDDVAAIAEVVRRRYYRLQQEHTELPNLIIIDGGRGQLNSAMHELERLNVQVPVISLAKQFEEIYVPGRLFPIRLEKKEKALLYLQEIRDEAHRFALAYNRLLRKKKLRT